MATTAFDLQSRIGLDTSEFDSGIEKTRSSISDFAGKIGGVLKSVGSAAVTATKAVVDVGKSLVSNVADLANYGDNIDKASQKLGISAKGYQEWQAVLQHSGTDMSSMTASFKSLANAANGATEQQAAAFERLGLSLDYVGSISAEDLFKEVITRLQDMGESTERTAIASDLLGKGAMELGALLNTSSEDTQAMIDRVNELGGVMSDEAVKAAANFNDQLQDMKTAFDGAKRSVLSEFLPALSQAMVAITSLVTNAEDAPDQIMRSITMIGTAINNGASKLLDLATELVPQMIENIISVIPYAIEKVLTLLDGVDPAFVAAISKLLEMLPDILTSVIQLITKLIPSFVDTGVEIVLALVDALIVAAPQLLTAAVEIITSLALALTEPDTLVSLVNSAIQLIIVLINGIIDALPQLIEVAPQIIVNLVIALIKAAPQLVDAAVEIIRILFKLMKEDIPNAVTDFIKNLGIDLANGFKRIANDAKTWGVDLMHGFIDGITSKIADLKDKVKNVAQSVKDFIGFSEPKEGPLSNFHTYAPDMMQLFADGIRENEDLITDQFEESFGKLSVNATGGSGIYNSSYAPVINVNANVSSDYDTDRMIQRISQGMYALQRSEAKAVGF